jgi:hypothetical protein
MVSVAGFTTAHDIATRYPDDGSETIDTAEFLARVLMHIPDPRRHQIRYYGAGRGRPFLSIRISPTGTDRYPNVRSPAANPRCFWPI